VIATCATCGDRIVITRLGGRDELWQHDEQQHRGMVEIHQLRDVDWHSRALTAVLELASTGEPFVISEVIHLGVPDAPNPRTDWARIQKEAEELGWITSTGRLGHSVRPTAKRSPVTEWIGTAKARKARAA